MKADENMNEEERQWRIKHAEMTTRVTLRHQQPDDPPHITKIGDCINQLLRDQYQEEAKKQLEEALGKYPDEPRLLKLMQVILGVEGNHKEARAFGYRAIKAAVEKSMGVDRREGMHIHISIAINNLAMIAKLEGKTEATEVEALFLTAHFINPEHPDPIRNLAGLHAEYHRYESSWKFVQLLVELMKKLPKPQQKEAISVLVHDLDLQNLRSNYKPFQEILEEIKSMAD
ncbi:MAG: hypothetical protein AB1746_04530 [Candidatus Zixiibacteriota bacterium]